jgi:tripartite-type tricarboxylate transporter receptor subunit TctC
VQRRREERPLRAIGEKDGCARPDPVASTAARIMRPATREPNEMFTYRSIKTSLSFLVAMTCVLALAVSASATETAKAFYQGKTVKFVVGYGPGGGYDTYARMLAPYLTKALGATVVVENQPGAGGINALNKVYGAAPDGLQIMIVNGTGAALNQLIGTTSVHFDLSKIGHLGTVSASPWLWIVHPGFTPTTPTAIMKSGKTLRWGGAGIADALSDGADMTCEALKLKCKVVIGYKGSHDVALAVARGEMDAMYVSDTSANDYVRNKEAVPVASMSPERSRFFPDLKTIYEDIKMTPEQKWWFDFRSKLDDMGRILVTTPGIPKDRLEYLQAAVKKVLTDPKLIAEGEKSQRYIKYIDADKTRASALSLVASISPERKQQVKEVVEVKFH